MGGLWVRVAVLVSVLLVAGIGGLIWRERNGRIRPAGKSLPDAPQANAPPADAPQADASTADDRSGRDSQEADHAVVWAELGIEPNAAAVTLVQFSSAFCAPCRATRQILTEVAAQLSEVHHIEVDAESHLDVVRALDVRSTPTTLLVDRSGRVAARAVGAPRKTDVLAAVGPFLAGSEQSY